MNNEDVTIEMYIWLESNYPKAVSFLDLVTEFQNAFTLERDRARFLINRWLCEKGD